MKTNQIKPKIRTELRSTYPVFFKSWKGKNLSAQHRFIDIGDGSVILSFLADPILQSWDDGKTWDLYEDVNIIPPCTVGLYRIDNHWIAIQGVVDIGSNDIGGVKLWRSFNAGITWMPPEKIPTADDIHFRGLGKPNVFSAIMTTRGRIIIVADHLLGQEGPDGQLISAVSSDDFGRTWTVSRLFGPAAPLPNGPEGFGEPAVVEMSSGRLWMVFRTPYGELWQCISRDGGVTWNDPTPTGLASPIANCYAKHHPDSGATILCWNLTKPGAVDDFHKQHGLYGPRINLVFAVSHDNCRTWSCPVVVEEKGGFYPTIHFSGKDMFIMYQSCPDYMNHPWHEYGLTMVTYDKKEVDSLPAWTTETIQPYIDKGLVAHWLSLACGRPKKETIS